MQTKQVKLKKITPPPVVNKMPQKIIRNQCLQSLEIYFIDETGKVDTHWLMPKEMFKIPSAGVTSQLKLLRERRMIQIRDV
mgnify:CR=1 FL=1